MRLLILIFFVLSGVSALAQESNHGGLGGMTYFDKAQFVEDLKLQNEATLAQYIEQNVEIENQYVECVSDSPVVEVYQ